MKISYNKLWKLLIDKKIKKTDLMKKSGISSNVLAKLGRDENISMDSVAKICKVLECNVGDIMEFSDENQ